MSAVTMTDEAWKAAACKGKPWTWWFPKDIETGRQAVSICQACPIRQLCQEYAQEHEEIGIWGGFPYRIEVDGLDGQRLATKLSDRCPKGHPYGKAVHHVRGKPYRKCLVCKRIRDKARVRHERPNITPAPELARRDGLVRQYESEGLTGREIASRLGVSIRTVERSRKRVRVSG